MLTLSGHVQRITGGGPKTLTITAFQTDFTLPSGSVAGLTSVTSSIFSDIPGGSTQSFQSWYNNTSPATPPAPFGIPAPLLVLPLAGTDALGGKATLGGLPGSSSFSLTSQIVLTIGGATGATCPDVVFGGKTQLNLQAVPEPSGVLLLAIGAPTALLVVRRVRHARGRAVA
ncbi:PEP-CTERM sorting domain-containing protein [Aquisphaera giovannonii]|uniref:PEP-CTERM sorting domain-containing protein n=1 Tax=Aquisphaera giovannonii TaxID=406548 RepID=UPI0011DF1818|nr:PEP-CTERM sorting domain-containing protein [Aquisphaera giovannonii]